MTPFTSVSLWVFRFPLSSAVTNLTAYSYFLPRPENSFSAFQTQVPQTSYASRAFPFQLLRIFSSNRWTSGFPCSAHLLVYASYRNPNLGFSVDSSVTWYNCQIISLIPDKLHSLLTLCSTSILTRLTLTLFFWWSCLILFLSYGTIFLPVSTYQNSSFSTCPIHSFEPRNFFVDHRTISNNFQKAIPIFYSHRSTFSISHFFIGFLIIGLLLFILVQKFVCLFVGWNLLLTSPFLRSFFLTNPRLQTKRATFPSDWVCIGPSNS